MRIVPDSPSRQPPGRQTWRLVFGSLLTVGRRSARGRVGSVPSEGPADIPLSVEAETTVSAVDPAVPVGATDPGLQEDEAATRVEIEDRQVADLRAACRAYEQQLALEAAALARARDELQRQADQLAERNRLLDLVHDAVLVRDLYGTIVYWNEAAAGLYGWTPAEALGRVSHELLRTEYGTALPDIEKGLIDAGRWTGEVVQVTRDGERLPVEVRWALTRNRRGLPEGCLEVHRDLRPNRILQALEARAEVLARSNADLASVAWTAAHEIKEPLRVIAGHVGLLDERYGPRFDRNGRELAAFAIDAARRMQRMVDDLVFHASVEHQRLGARLQPTEPLVDAALTHLAGVIAEVDASVIVDALPSVVCDGPHITRVFQNLIGNALKFRHRDRTAVVRISASREEDAWRLTVSDNGIGLEAANLDRIFGLFCRLHGHEVEGAGLGLVICRSIVERHGGRMDVRSTPGEGSAFSFTLPDAPPGPS